jgi:flagellar biosynthesis/type III secretory pathway M-ring protein FliF/YscJ
LIIFLNFQLGKYLAQIINISNDKNTLNKIKVKNKKNKIKKKKKKKKKKEWFKFKIFKELISFTFYFLIYMSLFILLKHC